MVLSAREGLGFSDCAGMLYEVFKVGSTAETVSSSGGSLGDSTIGGLSSFGPVASRVDTVER
jgi:hypothetical protein